MCPLGDSFGPAIEPLRQGSRPPTGNFVNDTDPGGREATFLSPIMGNRR
jgi:hypothetical protein